MPVKYQKLILLLIILALAAFFRFYKLDSIPPGIYPDEAMNANDALAALKTGNFKVFYPENNGREGLFINLTALSFRVFGAGIWPFKIVPAIIGLLTVLGLYLMSREFFKYLGEEANNRIALFATFFLAVSFWHVNFSRISFRAIFTPFILVFAFYFLFKGFRTKKSLNFILAGLIFGLGFHTYIAFRVAALLLPAILVLWWISQKREITKQQFLKVALKIFIPILIITLPILIYFIKNPDDFVGRASGVSVFADPHPLQAFIVSLLKHLAMFNFAGDKNWRHNFSGAPQLFWPVGIFFLIGLWYAGRAFYDFISPVRKLGFLNGVKKLMAEPPQFLLPLGCLALWLIVMLAPGILSIEGVPHALRTIGVIPAAYILAGLGCWRFLQLCNQKRFSQQLLSFGFAFLIAWMFFAQFNQYFLQWASRKEVADAFAKDYVELGNYLNSLPDDTQKYVVVNQSGVPVPYPGGLPMPAQTPMFIESIKFGHPRATYLLPEDVSQIELLQKETIFVPLVFEQGLFQEISLIFRGGDLLQSNDIWAYKITR